MVTLSSTKEARIYNGKKIASLTSGAGKIGQPLVKKNETRTLSNTIHKNKFKMDWFLEGLKPMTNLDSILKDGDVTLPTNVRLVKATVFWVVMYGCERWTIK